MAKNSTFSSCFRKFISLAMLAMLPLLFLTGVRCQKINDEIPDRIDNAIFDKIHQILTQNYSKDEKKVTCMVEDLKKNKIVDRFYKLQLLSDNELLMKEIQPYLTDAESNCETVFFTSPLGIGIIAIIAVVLLLVAGFFGWKVMTKKGQANLSPGELELPLK